MACKSIPKWLNSSAIKQKHKSWNTCTHRHSDYVSYTTKKNIVTTAVKRAKSNFELKLVDRIKEVSYIERTELTGG